MQTLSTPATGGSQNFSQKMVGYMLAHEQFPLPELL